MKCFITPTLKRGSIEIPPSKSHTIRALFFAMLAHGKSTIYNPLLSADTFAMIDVCRSFGAIVNVADHIEVIGVGGIPQSASDIIQAGNSGLIYRFITALAAHIPHHTIITGDESIRTQRPIAPLLNALKLLGATAISANGSGAPVIVKGPINKTEVTVDGSDSQFVSALIYSLIFSPHPTTIHIENMKEKPWIELSLSWLDRLAIPYQFDGSIQLMGNAKIEGFEVTIPADFSSAAPFLVLQHLGHPIELTGLNLEDAQGDKVLIEILKTIEGDVAIDMDQCIDLLPILAVLGCFTKGETKLYNAAVARTKESDRLEAISSELRKMGAQIAESEDRLTISYSPLRGAHLESHRDHRIAMALAVAALNASGESQLNGIECVAKTFPQFFDVIGVDVESYSDRLQTVG